MQETQAQSLGWEDWLEEGLAARPSLLAWRVPWTEEPGGLQSVGSQSRTRRGAHAGQIASALPHPCAFIRVPLGLAARDSRQVGGDGPPTPLLLRGSRYLL